MSAFKPNGKSTIWAVVAILFCGIAIGLPSLWDQSAAWGQEEDPFGELGGTPASNEDPFGDENEVKTPEETPMPEESGQEQISDEDPFGERPAIKESDTGSNPLDDLGGTTQETDPFGTVPKTAEPTTQPFGNQPVTNQPANSQPMTNQSNTAGAGSNYQAGVVQQPESTFEGQFWKYLTANNYKNWAPAPNQNGDFYEGRSPHGAYLKMYLNRTAIAASDELPHGSVIVKENYGVDKSLKAITVMYRAQGYNAKGKDWYWVKYNPDGTVARTAADAGNMKIAGAAKGCIECHEGADGDDYAFFNDQ